ncbi:MAG TPA: hypothetical protein VEC99_16340 [Clostridia bacterium]|nr:hypothetical protein [Clostridia bacterium]
MKTKPITELDRALARVCLNCPVCKNARKKQKGAAFWLTSKVETRVCPFCRAYERVYGRKAHQPLEHQS